MHYLVTLGVFALLIIALFYLLNIDIAVSIFIACGVSIIYTLVRLRNLELIKKYLLRAVIVVAVLLGLAVVSYWVGSLIFPEYWSDVLGAGLGWNMVILGFMPLSELIYWTLIMSAVYIELGEPPGKVKKPGREKKLRSNAKKRKKMI